MLARPRRGWPGEAADARFMTWSARRMRVVDRKQVLAAELEALMLDHGADGTSFETIVAAWNELG